MKTHYRLLVISIIVFIQFSQCTTKDQEKAQPIKLTALNSMQRLLPGEVVKGKDVVDIKAAKNEYEAFQVVISTGKDKLENVKIEIYDLEGTNGRIGKENITMFREGLVYLRYSTPKAKYAPGLYPDPLIPFVNPISGDSLKPYHNVKTDMGTHFEGGRFSAYPINLFPDQNCIIWVDVYIPADAIAGMYSGVFKVTAGSNTATIPVELKIWDFVLPDIATHRTHMGHFSNIARYWGIDKNSQKSHEIEMLYCKELARCRVNPPIPHSLMPEVNDDGSLTIIPEKHEKLVQYIEETHLVDFEVARTPFMSNTSNSDNPTPKNQTDPVAFEKSKRYYQEMYSYLKENGWDKRAYIYLIDEPNSVKDYNQVINLAKVAEEGAPDLQRLVVEQTYKHDPSWPDLDHSVDIWCTLFGFVDRKTIKDKIAQGDEVWSYSALTQPSPQYHPEYEKLKDMDPPYWHIDQPVMAYRVPTWLNRQYDITGLLYWTMVGWYGMGGPWLSPEMGPHGYHRHDDAPGMIRTNYYNGGGTIFYPGKEAGIDGPVTSIRLKNLREGLEDYEYFAILDKNGQEEFVIETINEICPEWWDIKMDPDALLKVRERLARRIEML